MYLLSYSVFYFFLFLNSDLFQQFFNIVFELFKCTYTYLSSKKKLVFICLILKLKMFNSLNSTFLHQQIHYRVFMINKVHYYGIKCVFHRLGVRLQIKENTFCLSYHFCCYFIIRNLNSIFQNESISKVRSTPKMSLKCSNNLRYVENYLRKVFRIFFFYFNPNALVAYFNALNGLMINRRY